MATELAKAYVQIIPSAVGIQGRIQKEIEPEADSAGSSFGGKMVGILRDSLTVTLGNVCWRDDRHRYCEWTYRKHIVDL